MDKYAPLNLSAEDIITFTPEWTGERFNNGRPRVPDDILARMESVTLTQAWTVLRNKEYHWQYEGNWLCTQPGKVLVGRAVTAVYMPRRPDVRPTIYDQAHASGCIGDQVSWPIDRVRPNGPDYCEPR